MRNHQSGSEKGKQKSKQPLFSGRQKDGTGQAVPFFLATFDFFIIAISL